MVNTIKLFSLKKLNFFYSIVIFQLLMLLSALILGWFWDISWWHWSFSWIILLWGIGGFTLLIGLSLVLSLGAVKGIKILDWYLPFLKGIFLPLINLLPANLYWAVALSAAIGEETLFRGVLQNKYGLVITAISFAVLHAPPIPRLIPLMIVYIFMSFVLGATYHFTNNIYILIAIHFAYDWIILCKLNKLNSQFSV